MDLVDHVTRSLADPETTPGDPDRPASLATGAAGITLLHIEDAYDHPERWPVVHRWLRHAVRDTLRADQTAGALNGPPALWFVVRAAHGGSGRYHRAVQNLADATVDLTRIRLDHACARIDRGDLPTFHEFDVIHGLTGLGALHLHHHPEHPITTNILNYLVRLTHPIPGIGHLPGWWANHSPQLNEPDSHPGGHGNLGLAHGISGPLALLATALRRGITVTGHTEAIARICAWLDHWQQDAPTGPWWPGFVSVDEARLHQVIAQPGQLRPSWCYGVAGVARAQQLAGIACGDQRRRDLAENAMLSSLRDPAQRAQLTNPGLCHGGAGLFQTTWRMANDSANPNLAGYLPQLARELVGHLHAGQWPNELFEGSPGAALALRSFVTGRESSNWDTPLLLR
jgi:hypothetical protein